MKTKYLTGTKNIGLGVFNFESTLKQNGNLTTWTLVVGDATFEQTAPFDANLAARGMMKKCWLMPTLDKTHKDSAKKEEFFRELYLETWDKGE